MADTYTSSLLLTQPEVGENLNVWGGKLNAMFELVDKSVVGRTGYTLSGNKTLTRANGAADEARQRFQDITGGTGGTVTIPSVSSWYLIRNNATGNVTFTTGGDTMATIAPNTVTFVVCDGANVWSPNLNGYITQVEALIADAIADMNALLDAAEAQVTLATTQANNASTFSISAGNSATAAAVSAAAAAQSAKDAALFDPSSYYTKTATDNLLTAKAPLASPAFTGNPTAPTATAGDNDTSIATTAFVQTAVASVPPGLALISSGTISSPVAALDITSGIDATYDEYELHFFNLIPASADNLVGFLTSNAGSSWINNYRYGPSGGAVTSGGFFVAPTAGVGAGYYGCSGRVVLLRPADVLKTQFRTAGFALDGTNVMNVVEYANIVDTTAAATNGIRLKFTTQNITSGKYKLYGLKK